MENTKKTYLEDIDRSIYDVVNEERHRFVTVKGLNEEIIREISKQKDEPEWMLDLRLKSLKIYNSKPMPTWGADISELDVDNIVHYVRPDTDMSHSWDDVPEDIKDTFERLGIPQAERESLAGVGAQYDSEVVYHNLKDELIKKGVVYLDMESGVKQYEDM